MRQANRVMINLAAEAPLADGLGLFGERRQAFGQRFEVVSEEEVGSDELDENRVGLAPLVGLHKQLELVRVQMLVFGAQCLVAVEPFGGHAKTLDDKLFFFAQVTVGRDVAGQVIPHTAFPPSFENTFELDNWQVFFTTSPI